MPVSNESSDGFCVFVEQDQLGAFVDRLQRHHITISMTSKDPDELARRLKKGIKALETSAHLLEHVDIIAVRTETHRLRSWVIWKII